jgi:molybdate transport system substrate-binding protein
LLLTGGAFAADVNVSSAGSLRDLLGELARDFSGLRAGARILNNSGASGTLARQIASGAPCDIFISANSKWMDYLRSRGLVDPATVRTFAHNSLVFVGAQRSASSLQDLPKLGRIAIGSPGHVPAGEYALEALRKAGIERELQGKLVFTKDVRQSLAYAESGDVDGAFVYRTDALQARHARILFTVPPQLYSRISYCVALTPAGARNGDASAFYAFLQGDEGRLLLEQFGFALPSSDQRK